MNIQELRDRLSEVLVSGITPVRTRLGEVIVLHMGSHVDASMLSASGSITTEPFPWQMARCAGIEMPGTRFVEEVFEIGPFLAVKISTDHKLLRKPAPTVVSAPASVA